MPVILKSEDKENIAGSHVQLLLINELKASFDILKSTPKTKLT